jgi:hypothetical protein
MATTQDRILESSDHNKRILQTLAETDYAIPAMQQNNSYINDLKAEIPVREKNVQVFKNSMSKELYDHEKYRDSTVKRLAYKMGGKKEKFAEKAEKEEREYVAAVQEHFNAQRQLDLLKSSLAAAVKTHNELLAASVVHSQAQTELDALYNSIFAGPTPDFPEEDAKEEPVRRAEGEFREGQLRLSAESQAKSILLDASKFMGQCLADLEEAHQASTMDICGVGGSFADMAERSALSKAQSHASQVEMLIEQACRAQPQIRGIGPLDIAQGNMMSDILFDNIFSDMDFHQKIKKSLAQVIASWEVLQVEIHSQIGRENTMKAKVARLQSALEVARQDLQDIRARTFESVAGGLPDYSA